ncbi:phosphoglyceromutase [Mycena leptocephala]|nr:phosphoglyceromutase [Mycena leptocephala]
MIPSPKIATYDLQPEISVQAVAGSAITHRRLRRDRVRSVPAAGHILLITANHGNAEQMRDAKTGAPHTAYTCNPVPFILAGNRADGYALVQHEEKNKSNNRDEDEEVGAPCNVAPTELDLMSLDNPCNTIVSIHLSWQKQHPVRGRTKLEG